MPTLPLQPGSEGVGGFGGFGVIGGFGSTTIGQVGHVQEEEQVTELPSVHDFDIPGSQMPAFWHAPTFHDPVPSSQVTDCEPQ